MIWENTRRLKKPKEKGVVKSSARVKVLDTWFSKYIRLLNSTNFYCTCCTCGKIDMWSNMDCGHFIGRQKKALRWDERNCNPQCKYCNRYNEGRKYEYGEFLKKKYDEQMPDLLTFLGNKPKQFAPHEIEALISHYKGIVSKLILRFSS